MQSPDRKPPAAASRELVVESGVQRVIAEYFWFIFKNVIGWICIVGALPVGFVVPGPGGIPLFLIGFALVTFPGKRRLTSRVMRGMPVKLEPAYFTFLVTFVSILVTAAVLWFIAARYERMLNTLHLEFSGVQLLGVCALAGGVTWLTMRLLLLLLNFVLRRLPSLRRRMRPWLRRRGINLLPPRHLRGSLRGGRGYRRVEKSSEDEIVVFDEKYSRNAREFWELLKPWLRRLFAVAITVAIFVGILKPITVHWYEPEVQSRLARIDIRQFIVSAAMFAVFLFVFRAMAWRRIVGKLGYALPIPAATRIWSSSELARYVPGAIVQVIGRVYLAKPYGVRGSVITVSQIIELAIFLLANVLVAVACLLYFGFKNLHGVARTWMFVAALLIPILLCLLHPRVCYGLINAVMRRLGKPEIAQPLSWRQMFGILAWNILGLLWQSVAVYLLTRDALGLKPDWWWIVAGAYCLSWCAGFLAVWAPGGIGVRELVFVAAMSVTLPRDVQAQLASAGSVNDRAVILGLLSVLLRLWATTGELMLAAIAYAADYRGALGRADAPGRVAPASLSSPSTPATALPLSAPLSAPRGEPS